MRKVMLYVSLFCVFAATAFCLGTAATQTIHLLGG
jgi:hypothetical protein